MKIGLYFGTFNPVHIGHLAIANYMVEFTEIQQLWFIISPQNPFKEEKNLLKDYHRLQLVRRAIEDDPRFRASAVEFNLPRPSYTIDTLVYLQEEHPGDEFFLIMGADNLESIHKWKNYEMLLGNYGILVYPRPGYEIKREELPPRMQVVNAPLMEISASFIRKAIEDGKDIRHFLPAKAYQYLDEMNFYKKRPS